MIPDHLRRYFWEYDPARLSLDGNRHTILLRLLQEGGLDAVQWLRQNVGEDEIRTMLVRRRGRGINPKRLLLLDLPNAKMDDWIAAERSSPWNRRRSTGASSWRWKTSRA